MNLDLNPHVTTIMSGHENIRSYLHWLKIIDSPKCSCKRNIQTVDHLILQCERLKYKRRMLKNSVLKAGNWPINKSELINKNLKQFIRYINSMDLKKLNHSKSCKWTLTTDMYDYVCIYIYVCIITLACSITYCNGACWRFNNNNNNKYRKGRTKVAFSLQMCGYLTSISQVISVRVSWYSCKRRNRGSLVGRDSSVERRPSEPFIELYLEVVPRGARYEQRGANE
jgi:hypothetical protein